ncbi:hypothetical protein AB5I41_25990 [Sphingomonas sp. MMS24-JH45]
MVEGDFLETQHARHAPSTSFAVPSPCRRIHQHPAGFARSNARPAATPVAAPFRSASFPFTNSASTPTPGSRGWT